MNSILKTLLAITALSWALLPAVQAAAPAESTTAAKSEPTEKERAELEKKLEDARGRLEEAAREVAQLSGKLTGPIAHDFFIANRMQRGGAMIGIGIADEREENKEGVAVQSVVPDGPAAKAGIKSGDLIISVDGKSLKDAKSPGRELVKHMRSVEPGHKVKVEYLRDGKKGKTELTAEPMDMHWAMGGGAGGDRNMRFYRSQAMPMVPGKPAIPGHPGAPDGPDGPMGGTMMFSQFLGPDVLDMELVTLTPKLGNYFGAERGVLVVRAPSDSAIKLEEGDVILDIDGRQPQSGVHAMRILRSYQPGEEVTFNVLRNRKSLKLVMSVPEAKDVLMPHGGVTGPRIEVRPRTFKIPTPPPREEST